MCAPLRELARIARPALLAGGVAFALGDAAWARRARRCRRAWPIKPIRLVSPFNPGGAIDVLQPRSSPRSSAQRLGQQVIVDAVPGANTIVGADVVAKAAPDGYTFMITTMSTHVNNTVLFRQAAVRPGQGLRADHAGLARQRPAHRAGQRAGYSDLKGFVAWARQQNRPISYGSWGIGSSANVYGEILARDHGVSLTHVPYRASSRRSPT